MNELPTAGCVTVTTLSEVLDLGIQALSGVFPKSFSVNVPAGPLKLVKCGACGLVQLPHNYDPSQTPLVGAERDEGA